MTAAFHKMLMQLQLSTDLLITKQKYSLFYIIFFNCSAKVEEKYFTDSLEKSFFTTQENQTLNKELVMARKMEDSFEDAQESVRRARQEAREERVASARLREDCARLQVPVFLNTTRLSLFA